MGRIGNVAQAGDSNGNGQKITRKVSVSNYNLTSCKSEGQAIIRTVGDLVRLAHERAIHDSQHRALYHGLLCWHCGRGMCDGKAAFPSD